MINNETPAKMINLQIKFMKLIMRSLSGTNYVLALFLFLCLSTILACHQHNYNNIEEKQDDLKGTIYISGAFALFPLIADLAYKFELDHPGVKIYVMPGSSNKGKGDAALHITDIGLYSKEAEMDYIRPLWFMKIAKDGVVLATNAENPCMDILKKTGVTRKELYDIFISGKIDRWSDLPGIELSNKINLFTRSDASGGAAVWSSFIGGVQADLLGTGVYGDPGMLNAITGDMFSLGYFNLRYCFDPETRSRYKSLEIIPLDLNENGQLDPEEDFYESLDDMIIAIKNKTYPFPPARELYIICNQLPEDLPTVTFLIWILTEGQKYIEKEGYVKLDQDDILKELEKLYKTK